MDKKCILPQQSAAAGCIFTVAKEQYFRFYNQLLYFLIIFCQLQSYLHNYLLNRAWFTCLASWLVGILRRNHDQIAFLQEYAS